ncbi:protein Niban 2-like isoform X2 [Notolabrus celidotus]|uniref:protein Niban 2-like isoform X2 n=1 Tax=Notolabrus celidotus TaxID=1203425 RepID=UPI00148F680D|nr:protein Niban 2-like isoform X2 [Notolabrus celidotus]
MGDVVSSHLDESKREMITARTRDVMKEFSDKYEQQYAVALFNSVRYEIEGGGGKQSQLLHRKDPLAGRSIFSGNLFQHLEENRKFRNRYVSVPNSYTISLYESKTAHDRGLHPKTTINCAGYKALASMEEYMELINSSLPGIKAKVGNHPFIKSATEFPLILWHPYARHYYFCVMTEKEQKKWHAVLQDCVRHTNNGLPEEQTVQTPAFTDAVRLYRQAKGHYGTWDMMCGKPPQILANLVMETLHPELRNMIGPRLKGKMQQRQRNWMLVSDAVYRQVLSQTTGQYNALVGSCEAQKLQLDASLRTDMDQIITSKEHVSNKIRALVSPKAEQVLRTNVQPYISSILEALMEPTSRGFSEVRDVFFRELVEISKNSINGGDKEKLGDDMERLSMLAFHPVKMQSCYEQVEQLNLEGLQQRFDVSNPSVFVSRAQILMREQMDNAVYTFEQLLNQSLQAHGDDDVCKTIQGCQDRVLKKYDYDSSTVRKKFFREALLQINIPYMLQQLSPSFSTELPRFKELIFEDFSRFLLVDNMFEEVVLQSVSKDIMMAVKEAAVQRRHNLYRDSIILTNSDPNLHLLEDNSQVDWAAKFGGDETEDAVGGGGGNGGGSGSRRRQVVSMIQLDGVPLEYESCLEVPGVDLIPEEGAGMSEANEEEQEEEDDEEDEEEEKDLPEGPKSPDCVYEIRDLINPVVEMVVPVSEENQSEETNGTEPAMSRITMEDGVEEDVTHVTTVVEDVPMKSPRAKSSPQSLFQKDAVPNVTTGTEDVPMKSPQDKSSPLSLLQKDAVANVNTVVEDVPMKSPQDKSSPQSLLQEEDVTNVSTLRKDVPMKSPQDKSSPQSLLQEEDVTNVTTVVEDVPMKSPRDKSSTQSLLQQLKGSRKKKADIEHQVETATKNAVEAIETAVQEDERIAEISTAESDSESSPKPPLVTDSSSHGDSGFQSPTNEDLDEGELITNGLNGGDKMIDPVEVEVEVA